MKSVRQLGLAVIAIAAIAVWFVMEPEDPEPVSDSIFSSDSYGDMIDIALAEYDINNANTESAPQQQVVNGWVARDLLTIVARENADLLEVVKDDRTPTLLLLGVIAIAWLGLTTPPPVTPAKEEQVATVSSASPPPPAAQ